jgi:4-alpha-glucanotransferase
VSRAADLRRLADRLGILPEYRDMFGDLRQTSNDAREALAAALGFPCDGPHGPRERLAELEAARAALLVDPVGILWTDAPPAASAIRVRLPPRDRGSLEWQLQLRLESGESVDFAAARRRPAGRDTMRIPLPRPLPWGYHRVRGLVRVGRRSYDVAQLVIVAPTSCVTVDTRLGGRRGFGIVTNLYAVRSEANWGAGDCGDLRTLVQLTAEWGGAFVGVSPLHAVPNAGTDVSPYSPVSRLYRNPLYLDVEAVPEWRDARAATDAAPTSAPEATGEALRRRDRVNYEGVSRAKLATLRDLYDRFTRVCRQQRDAQRVQAYHSYVGRRGETLDRFATFMALADRFGHDWCQWPEPYRTCDGAAVQAFRMEHAATVDFHRYLQYELDRQLGVVGTAARTALPVGLYGDMALGSAPGSADTWSFPGLFALDARLGAPPDDYSATGQNWDLPPMRPRDLRASGYRYWIDLIRSAMRHVGAIRLDHVMGLFRQFWIPRGGDGRAGAYVRFPADELLAILALESRRSGAVVIGEDLGTVPRGLSTALRRRGILSTRVLYYERDAAGRFKPSKRYSARAIVTATTHDNPPLAGYWAGTDIDLLARAGAIADADVPSAHAERATARARLRSRLASEGVPIDDDPPPERLCAAVYGFLAGTPAPLLGIALDDLTGETTPVNLPGVGMDRHPSWTRRNGVPLEDLRQSPIVRAVMRAVESRTVRR